MDITARPRRVAKPRREKLIKIRVTHADALRFYAVATAEEATISAFARRVLSDYVDAREREKATA